MLGLQLETVMDIATDRVRIASSPSRIEVELVQTTDDTTVWRASSPRRGGLPSLLLRGRHLAETLIRLEGRLELIDIGAAPRCRGPCAFIHPRSCHVCSWSSSRRRGPAWTSLGFAAD